MAVEVEVVGEWKAARPQMLSSKGLCTRETRWHRLESGKESTKKEGHYRTSVVGSHRKWKLCTHDAPVAYDPSCRESSHVPRY